MANSTTGSIWALDTAEAVSTNPVTIMGFVYKPAANSDDIILKDSTGMVILDWDASADITLTPQIGVMFPKPKTYNGLTVDTIDGGVLYVYTA